MLTQLGVTMQSQGKASFAKGCSALELTTHEAAQRQHGALTSL